MKKTSLAEQYQQVGTETDIEDANAHKLISMLLEGALEKISTAKFFISKNDIAGKGQSISVAITILDGLQASLNQEKGGDIAKNLYQLYQYMMERLLIANLDSNIEILDEVSDLLLTIKSGWDGIEEQAAEYLEQKQREDRING